MQNKIENIFQALSQRQFSIREKAINDLMNLSNSADLNSLFKRITSNKNSDSNMLAISLCETLLKRNSLVNSHYALLILCTLRNSENIPIVHRADTALDNYFKNSNIINSHKAFTIQKVWNQISLKEKEYIIGIISHYKFHSLINLVLTVFSESSLPLKEKAIDTLQALVESRGNKELRKIIRTEGHSLQKRAIEAIGTTGTAFDYLLYKNKITSTDEKIANAAITSARKNLENLVIPVYKKSYKSCTKQSRKHLIDELAYLKSPKALEFLINIMDSESNQDQVRHAQWSIYNIATKKKISTLIKNFYKRNKRTQYYILSILSDFQDDRCRDHFMEIIKKTDNQMIRKMALINLQSYNDKMSLMKLEELTSSDDKHVQFYAYRSLLNNKRNISQPHLLKLLEQKEALSENLLLLILNHLSFYAIKRHSKPIDKFLTYCYESSSESIHYAAIRAYKTNHHQKVVDKLLEDSAHHENELTRSLLIESLIHIINFNPFYLSERNLVYITKDFTSSLDIYAIKYLLLTHLLRLNQTAKNLALDNYFEDNKEKVPQRINHLMQESKLGLPDYIVYVTFLYNKNVTLDVKTLSLITDFHFKELDDVVKTYVIKMLLLSNKDIFYNFLLNQHDFIMKSNNLSNHYPSYMEAIL